MTLGKRLLGAIAFSFLGVLTACKTTTHLAGTTNVVLSTETADALEDYLNDPNGREFALSLSGKEFARFDCVFGTCDFFVPGKDGERAIEKCNQQNLHCRTFAVEKNILWKGNVQLPATGDSYRRLRVETLQNGLIRGRYLGEARAHRGTDIVSLVVTMHKQPCYGRIKTAEMSWALNCEGGASFHGRVEKTEAGGFVGVTPLGEMKFETSTDDWPTLRSALVRLSETQVAALGQVRKPILVTSGDTVYQGELRRQPNAKGGQIHLSIDGGQTMCLGKYSMIYGLYGRWTAACADGQHLAGRLRTDEGHIVGEGQTRGGDELTFKEVSPGKKPDRVVTKKTVPLS